MNTEYLVEALSMDRGQQVLSSEERKELIKTLLNQQRNQVRTLMDCQIESLLLGIVAKQNPEDEYDQCFDSKAKNINTVEETDVFSLLEKGNKESFKKDKKEKLQMVVQEIYDSLQLSSKQKRDIEKLSKGADNEFESIARVDASLEAIISNSWLMNGDVEKYTNQFTSIFSHNQLSKFLIWLDYNSEAIEGLDYVHAPLSSAEPTNEPFFFFGVNDITQSSVEAEIDNIIS